MSAPYNPESSFAPPTPVSATLSHSSMSEWHQVLKLRFVDGCLDEAWQLACSLCSYVASGSVARYKPKPDRQDDVAQEVAITIYLFVETAPAAIASEACGLLGQSPLLVPTREQLELARQVLQDQLSCDPSLDVNVGKLLSTLDHGFPEISSATAELKGYLDGLPAVIHRMSETVSSKFAKRYFRPRERDCRMELTGHEPSMDHTDFEALTPKPLQIRLVQLTLEALERLKLTNPKYASDWQAFLEGKNEGDLKPRQINAFFDAFLALCHECLAKDADEYGDLYEAVIRYFGEEHRVRGSKKKRTAVAKLLELLRDAAEELLADEEQPDAP